MNLPIESVGTSRSPLAGHLRTWRKRAGRKSCRRPVSPAKHAAVSLSLKGFYALADAPKSISAETPVRRTSQLPPARRSSVCSDRLNGGATEVPREDDICVERTDIDCRVDCHRRACSNWICMDIEVERLLQAVTERLERVPKSREKWDASSACQFVNIGRNKDSKDVCLLGSSAVLRRGGTWIQRWRVPLGFCVRHFSFSWPSRRPLFPGDRRSYFATWPGDTRLGIRPHQEK